MPVFTISFCALIIIIYILDTFILIRKGEAVTLKEKLWSGHNKGYINRALHLSEKKIKHGQVWRLLTSTLLHIGSVHIVGNSLGTLVLGYALESQLGTLKTLICFVFSSLISGLYMTFVYKLDEGEGASTGLYGLVAVFVLLAIKNGTILFSPLPWYGVGYVIFYTVSGMFLGKATSWEHISGFAGGLIIGALLVF